MVGSRGGGENRTDSEEAGRAKRGWCRVGS